MLVSIVVPVYNEEENIAIFYNAVTKVMTGLHMNMNLSMSMMDLRTRLLSFCARLQNSIRELRSCYWHGTLVIRLR